MTSPASGGGVVDVEPTQHATDVLPPIPLRLAPALTVVQLQRRVPRPHQTDATYDITFEPSTDAVQQIPIEDPRQRVSGQASAIEIARVDRCETRRACPSHPIPGPVHQQRQPVPNRHGTIDPRLGYRQRELRQQQIATLTIATAPRTGQWHGSHREHQRRNVGPLAEGQQIVDEHVRLDPDPTHTRHQLVH